MERRVSYSTPPDTMKPLGPYSHIAKAGGFITIGAVAGVDPATGELSGPDVASQTIQILDAFSSMLASVGSDLEHVIHINVFLTDMADFDAMNAAYRSRMGSARPARTAIAVTDVPKPGALLTMNLTAVTRVDVER
jgi:2-iminobutanoate/2-iminopropanoate deaminase